MQSLPCSRTGASTRRRTVAISCSMNSGWPSSRTKDCALVLAEIDDFLGHQRIHHVQDQRRQRAGAELVAESHQAEGALQAVIEAALHDQADLLLAVEDFI
jgi:hypothetical protein